MENRLKRLEAVQEAVLEISRISMSSDNIADFLQAVHQTISRLMYAANFYVSIYDDEQQSLRFVYCVDELDVFPPSTDSFSLASPEQSPTAWVILHRQPLLMTAEEDEARERDNGAWGRGARAHYWMGHPLLDQQRGVLGAMVTQIYDKNHLYTQEDQQLFGLIAGHVSTALQSLMSLDRLERAVKQRTAMLEHQVEERRKAETLQRALYQIAELSFLFFPTIGNFLACTTFLASSWKYLILSLPCSMKTRRNLALPMLLTSLTISRLVHVFRLG